MRRLWIMIWLALWGVGVAQAESRQVEGILFYADWCSACKKLAPKLEALNQPGQTPTLVITRVDLTNATRRQASLQAMQARGLGAIVQRYAHATGYMLLVDRDSQTVLDRVLSYHSPAQIRAKLERARQL